MDASPIGASSLFGPDEPICPYTGLRTFTEEEAIYFRGRKSHVAKCLALLVEHRFVMITGASGDGKSSLVFAGMLPEVRAGFVPARYSRWAVATFRPERSPLRNLAQALAPTLGLPDSSAVETELEQGFSALVQLYQASELCPLPSPLEELTPAGQQQQRQAANLLLVVDQFEEFFTNPENYDGDVPGTAAQTVVNLLLETVRLAQAQNLPIYIVCTMRSDFVGQCAEFKGLIEQVGASQYFVPRLLRHEFLEVIEEPAVLSGNRISERLAQRLLYDIGQGQDQLPVLQHALRRIWLAADQGREEMDLLHYAMVGGLAGELPAADRARFAAWRATLPAHQQKFLLENPGLRNVLDAHANQLYFEVNDLYNQDFQPPLPPGTAEGVIEQTFRVLTRTDGKRVVRNRVTGAQITAILDDAALPWPVVCRILRPFRAEGTTFLAPFLSEGEDGRAVLPPDAVLDISHESLIRNWNYLTEWAHQEAAEVRVAQNFIQQASRWQENAESKGFLLPIGLYTFFSHWHAGKTGAASWLAYYLAPGSDTALRHEQATTQNEVLTRFLKASRRHLWFSLVVARYGVKRLVLFLLLLALLGWMGRQAVRYRMAQSDYVAYELVKEGTEENSTLLSSYIDVADKARFILNADRLDDKMYRPWLNKAVPGDYEFGRLLDKLSSDTLNGNKSRDTLALNIELSMYACVDNMGYDSVTKENPRIKPILFDLENRLANALTKPITYKDSVARSKTRWRKAVLTARTIMAFAYYLKNQERRAGQPSDTTGAHRCKQGQQRRLQYLRSFLQQEVAAATNPDADPAPNPIDFAFCLRVLLAQGNNSQGELAFLSRLSPFAHPKVFSRFFPNTPSNYRTGYTTHSGGYPMAAIFFAALDSMQAMRKCLDSMATQKADFTDVNSGIALLPYLVKYQRLTPQNVHGILVACARPGGFSFNELYAALVYSLLSVQPTQDVFDANQSAGYRSVKYQNTERSTGYGPGYLSCDRVSFALPTAPRDVAWAALLKTTAEIAKQEAIFIESEEHDLANGVPENFYNRRNQCFLNAFLAKMHGVYLAEIRHELPAAQQAFTQFSDSLERLQRLLHPSKTKPAGYGSLVIHNPHRINALQWNLGLPQQLPQTTGTTLASTGPQSPVAFLRLPTRPKTLNFETYYTCPFDAFFVYELTREAKRAIPDTMVVQLLDSVAFVEAAFPDRFSATRSRSLFVEALARPAQYVPNLTWIKAIGQVGFLPNSAWWQRRQCRNELLLNVEAVLQNHRRLLDSVATRQLAQQLRPALKEFAEPKFKLPLQLAFSDLATAIAREGRLTEAYDIANTLDESMQTATKIRASEQAMLTNNTKQATSNALVAFGAEYTSKNKQPAHNGAMVPASLFPVVYWYLGDSGIVLWYLQNLFFAELSFNDLNNASTTNSLLAECKGYGLTNNSGIAKEQISDNESARARQLYYNALLTGFAHLKTSQPNDGWREYDEAELTQPADYDGPLD